MSFRKRTAPVVEETKAEVKETVVHKSTPSKPANKGGNGNFIKLGAILEKKDGGVYLKFDTQNGAPEITVNGRVIKNFQIEDPTAKFERMVNSGKMSEEDAEKSVAKIPDYVLYEVTAVAE